MYRNEKITEHIYRIVEKSGVCCYLVVGKDKACLIDACFGLGNIRDMVETLTDCPVFVVFTHGHCDHIGGSERFERVYLNNRDLGVFEAHRDYGRRKKGLLAEGYQGVFELEPVFGGRPEQIEDYQSFDLGGVHIQMIPVSGHTQGMMCPLIKEDRAIIFGDACGEGTLLWDENSSMINDYVQSLLKLKKFENQYDRVLRNHGSFCSDKELLDHVIESCHRIIDDKDEKQCVCFGGVMLYSCWKIDEQGQRVDGKKGNILYHLSKVKRRGAL